MQTVIHRADSRGYFDYGWLQTRHSFSFGNYHNPERMNFGLLRVFNDDIVAPAMGFSRHPHDNMEIVSIPLAGELAHKDSAGHEQVIKPNHVQVMSAGTGIQHSEYNHSTTGVTNFLQIWILPDAKMHAPRYDQKSFDPASRANKVQTLVSPAQDDETLWLHQDAYFSRADLDTGIALDYEMHSRGNGVYLFLVSGSVGIAGEELHQRDGMGVWETHTITMTALEKSEALLIEVPMV